jgi:hypothetical protein
MNERLLSWNVMFFLFTVVHGCATFVTAGFAFGLGEAGSILAAPLAIIASILAPLWILGEWLTFIIPDTIAIFIGIFANSILWWCVFIAVYSLIVQQKNNRKSVDSMPPMAHHSPENDA